MKQLVKAVKIVNHTRFGHNRKIHIDIKESSVIQKKKKSKSHHKNESSAMIQQNGWFSQ